ncbi:Uncharacterised protein [Candidatus Ornithobacterium hominis]|uniref:phage holin family protein n=1 Tax=Candidatus Ornithobacterium hominis TaxID=2497989 RepID=UPI000E5C3763|nr:phage holin family protein [Candidatus Ornithobacterium hominis]SZD72035.1 Uncharacterised protein [Candidatus Ornithobacterium hominis]
MILELLKENYTGIYWSLLVVSSSWLAVMLAIIVDFFFGVKKAKQIGEARTSEGYRRTINKATYYFALMFFALIFDFFDVISPSLLDYPLATMPFISLFCALGLVLTEAKSVRENAEDKLRRKTDDTFVEAIKIIGERQDLINKAIEIIEKNKENEQDNVV